MWRIAVHPANNTREDTHYLFRIIAEDANLQAHLDQVRPELDRSQRQIV